MEDTQRETGFGNNLMYMYSLTDCRTVTYSYHFRFRIKTILDKINEHLYPRPRPLQNQRLENGKFCPSRCFILDLRGGGLLLRFILSSTGR